MANNVRKRNKLSKNKKKSWKNVDIKEVEDFLEDERLQERTGGLVAEKTDEQLFVVDKRDDVTEKDESSQEKVTSLKRKRREPKPLRCHANLLPDPKIKPARIKHNVSVDKLEKRHKNVVQRLKEGKLTYTQLKAQQQRRTAIEEKKQRRRSKRRLPTADYDLWSEGDPNNNEDPHFLSVTKKRRINVPKTYREKPSEVPALEVPHPGASYNPAYDDHQELLRKAHNVEARKVREEQKIYNALEAKFERTDWKSIQNNWLSEMSAGLEDGEEEEEEESYSPEDLEKISVNPPVRREDIKPEKQRKQEEEEKKQEKIKLKETAKKERERDVYRLRAIKKEIHQQEKKKKEKAQKREQKKAMAGKTTRKLGKMKYEDPFLELKLSDELEGSLRLLKPEGNLFEDRFKSLQKRNVIEPRLRAKKQKHYRPKMFEKKSHRDVPEAKLS